jgi:hypothetical protein
MSSWRRIEKKIGPIVWEVKKYWGEEYPANSKRKANWIGDISSGNCLLKRVIEWKKDGSIEMKGRRGRRHKQVLDDLTETLWNRKLKEEALDRLALEEAMDLLTDKLRNERWPGTLYMPTSHILPHTNTSLQRVAKSPYVIWELLTRI